MISYLILFLFEMDSSYLSKRRDDNDNDNVYRTYVKHDAIYKIVRENTYKGKPMSDAFRCMLVAKTIQEWLQAHVKLEFQKYKKRE